MFCMKCRHELADRMHSCPSCGGQDFSHEPVPMAGAATLLPDALPSTSSLSQGSRYRLGLVSLVVIFFILLIGSWWIFTVHNLSVNIAVANQGGWDRLQISSALEKRSLWGDSIPVAGELQKIIVSDSAGRILYQGNSSSPSIPDATLRSGEPIRIEACLRTLGGDRTVCSGATIQASPKRVVPGSSIHLKWPLIDTAESHRGEYQLTMIRQREKFAEKGVWENAGMVTGKLLIEAVVTGVAESAMIFEAEADDVVHGFSLEQKQGYAGFRKAIDQVLAAGNEASVTFRVLQGEIGLAAMGGATEHYSGVRWIARPDTRSWAVLRLESYPEQYQVRLHDLLRGEVLGDIRNVNVDRASGTIEIDFLYRGGTRVSLTPLNKDSFDAWGSYPITLPFLGNTNVKVSMAFHKDGTASGEWSNMGFSGDFSIIKK